MIEQHFTILIVDDNPVNRELWSLYLGNEGYRVEVASNGVDALRMLEGEAIDLMLLDVMMPGLDGFETLETLRRGTTPEELPVIMVTSKDESDDIVRGFELGANDYIGKPVNLDVLLARIRIQLRTKAPAGDRVDPDLWSSSVIPAGTVLEGKFRLEGLIGQGSCGTVYRATHIGLHRRVAIKLLTSAAGIASAERLRREGISACRVAHPNAVEVLDLCVTDSGIPFLVMELLRGDSLDQELAREGSMSLARCGEILLPICEVLSEAHHQGIIHRDIKPQNVFLHHSRQGEIIKVLDFSIARIVGESVLHRRLTVEGSLVGTPAYMAPERFADAAYDGRADVYSVGIMLYEMLAGQRPFASADLLELIRLHMHEPPRPLRLLRPDLPQAVDAVALSALTKDPRERPTAERLAADFRAAVAEGGADHGGDRASGQQGPNGPRPNGPRPDGPRPDGSGERGEGGAADSDTEPWIATVLEAPSQPS